MKQSYITINHNALELEHQDLLPQEKCKLSIDFVRTLRIPDDNNKYNLPPGLGNFPLKHVEDFKNVPEHWQEHGGLFLPMYQSEAMWLKFNSKWPFAIKIAAGKINAISGEPWNPNLSSSVGLAHDQLARDTVDQIKYMEQYENHKNTFNSHQKPDYIVSPKQPWLDGFNVGKGLVRQFVAMPLGDGYTVEEQLTGQAEHGGIQIIAYPMKAEYYEKMLEEEKKRVRSSPFILSASGASVMSKGILRSRSMPNLELQESEMGLGAGGFMKQEIFADPYGIDAWDMSRPLKVFVHLLNSSQYINITGEKPPTKPLTPKEYKNYNFPWFDYYSDGEVLTGSDKLAKVDSIASLQTKKNENVLTDNSSIPNELNPIVIGKKEIKNGKW